MALVKRANDYIDETLGERFTTVSALRLPSLPLFLTDRYSFTSAMLFAQLCVLLTPRPGTHISAKAYGKHSETVSKAAGADVILVADHLDARTARGLITQHTAFIVPGSQLYLPRFAIHFRARRDRRQAIGDRLSPTAQLLVLAHLHHQPIAGETASRLAPRYHLSKMSVSRAVAELANCDLIEITQRARENIIGVPLTSRAFWLRAQPYLRSPVRKARTLVSAPPPPYAFLSGEAALSRYSSLDHPPRQTYAIADHDWKKMAGDYGPELDGFADEGTMTVETWSYDPALLANGTLVDRLSLWLAIHDHADERVAKAAEDMLEGFAF